jgi:zinc protease
MKPINCFTSVKGMTRSKKRVPLPLRERIEIVSERSCASLRFLGEGSIYSFDTPHQENLSSLPPDQDRGSFTKVFYPLPQGERNPLVQLALQFNKLVFLALILFLALCATAQAVAPRVEEVTSPGGITAWLVRDSKLPLIALRFAFKGGVEQDPEDKQGLAMLTASLLTEGAGAYDADAFQQKLADQSIQLNITAGRDAITGEMKTLRATRAKAFSLLRLALLKPRFDAEAVERARGQQLTALRFGLGNPSWQARYALFSHLFAGHPYDRRSLGSTKTLQSLTRDDIRDFAARHFARDNLVVAVTGDIAPEELAKELDGLFGALPARAQLTPVAETVWPEKTETILIPREGTQTEMLFALPMPKRDDPDWYAAEIANYILGGGGFSSRLMHAVRDEKGLTYGINTSLAPMDHAALLVGKAATDNAKAGEAWNLAQQVWRGFYEQGASDDEINAAKDYLTGALPLEMTSTDAIASVLLDMQLQHLGRDYLDRRDALIRHVSAEDVRRVIKRWFDPARLNLAVVGEPEGIAPNVTQEQVRE